MLNRRLLIDYRMTILLCGAFVGLLVTPGTGQTTQPTEPTSQPALPASLAGMTDEGEFVLYKDEEPLGHITSSWQPDGSFDRTSTLSMAGQTMTTTLSIRCGDDGLWDEMTIEAPVAKVSVVRDGETIRVTKDEKTTTISMKPNAVLFENFSPALISQAVRAYDREQGGKQTFPIFFLPGAIMDGSLERTDTVERRVGGRDESFTRYLYALPGVDIIIWMDSTDRFVFGDVPSQRAAYIRKGYESLRAPLDDDPLLSKAEHEVVVDPNVMMPMRDGVKLATDIYRPAGDGKFPVVLIRTPYQKTMSELDGKFYARRGYVCAIQDCRGRFASEGDWEAFVNEPKDGYDAVEWLAAQPWSTGKVGMIGASYLGWVQWWAAAEHPPHLVTIIPNVAPPDPFYNMPYEYGVYFLWAAIWWAEIVQSEATADLSGKAFSEIMERDYHELLRDLPVIDLDRKIFGSENPAWRAWITHNRVDDYWEPVSFLDRLENVNIPVFNQSGWFDGDGIGSKLNYLAMARHGHPHQKLVLGPWGHSDVASRMIGDEDFGEKAIIDLPREYLRWFDHWLKGVDNGIEREPLVSLFVMGRNDWLHGPTYPLPQTDFRKLYLHSGGKANTSKGDGTLSWEPPAADARPDLYTYNPGEPTPNPNMVRKMDEEKEKEISFEEKEAYAKAYHETITSTRDDILVYQTEPLTEPVTVCGPLSATLYASSSAKDTDWFVRFMTVDEKDEIFPLAEGKIRARFRESMRDPTPLEPGKMYEYTLDLWQTGIEIPKGHRMRVEVASASFPFFSRNLNTGGHNEMETAYVSAEQTVYHDAARPSHVLLPVIPATKAPE